MLKNHQFYYLLAKLVHKGRIDWENDRDLTESEREAIRQGMRDLAYYSPFQAGPDKQNETPVQAGKRRATSGD